MSPLDRYIARATFGLPRKKRLDSAAELRVHLLQRVEDLQRQGFSREEAEHLAVERMGPPGPTWQRVITVVFSRRVGFVVAAGLATAIATWLLVPVLLRPAPSVHATPTTFDDVEPILSGVRSFDVVLPEEAVALRIGVQVRAGAYFESTGVLPPASAARLSNPRTARLVAGAAPASEEAECSTGTDALFVRSRVGNDDLSIAGCLPLGSEGVWQVIAPDGAPLRVDTWTPVVVFRPMETLPASDQAVIDETLIDEARLEEAADDVSVVVYDTMASGAAGDVVGVDGFIRRPAVDPDMWLVLSVYASSAEIGAFTTPPPPTGADVLAELPPGTSL